jgi:hypothetical protein
MGGVFNHPVLEASLLNYCQKKLCLEGRIKSRNIMDQMAGLRIAK